MTAVSISSVVRSFPKFTIQVTCKQGVRSLQRTTLPTTQWHKQSKPLCLHERVQRTAMFQGSQTAVPIRRNVLCHSKTMRAEPPSLYDGTTTCTQKHTAQCKKSCQHLFLVREHRRPHSHNRERFKQGTMFTALSPDTQQVESVSNDEALHTSTP